jgi:hypothetical protein
MPATIKDALRAWAWDNPTRAGVELLIATGKVRAGQPWIRITSVNPVSGRPEVAEVDLDELLDELRAWSSQEASLALLAASLLGGPNVNLNDTIPRLDTDVLDTVLACLALAGGIPSLHPLPN